MTRVRVLAAVAVLLGAAAVLAIARHELRPARGALAGTISSGRLCTTRTALARRACRRWLGTNPTLEISPAGRVGSKQYTVTPDALGDFRVEVPRGRYVAWWSEGTAGSITNRGWHTWLVASGRTTDVGVLTPDVGTETAATATG